MGEQGEPIGHWLTRK